MNLTTAQRRLMTHIKTKHPQFHDERSVLEFAHRISLSEQKPLAIEHIAVGFNFLNDPFWLPTQSIVRAVASGNHQDYLKVGRWYQQIGIFVRRGEVVEQKILVLSDFVDRCQGKVRELFIGYIQRYPTWKVIQHIIDFPQSTTLDGLLDAIESKPS